MKENKWFKQDLLLKLLLLPVIVFLLSVNIVSGQDCQYTYREEYIDIVTGFFYRNNTYLEGDILFNLSEGNITRTDIHNETIIIASSDEYTRLITIKNELSTNIRIEFLIFEGLRDSGVRTTHPITRESERTIKFPYNSEETWTFTEEDIIYRIIEPEGLEKRQGPVTKERNVCVMCEDNICLNDGIACSDGNECGGGYCVRGICNNNPDCYNNDCQCPETEVQCGNQCIPKNSTEIGIAPICDASECITNHIDEETGLCSLTKKQIIIKNIKKTLIFIGAFFVLGSSSYFLYKHINRKREIEKKIKIIISEHKILLAKKDLIYKKEYKEFSSKITKTEKTIGRDKPLFKKEIQILLLLIKQVEQHKYNLIKNKTDLIEKSISSNKKNINEAHVYLTKKRIRELNGVVEELKKQLNELEILYEINEERKLYKNIDKIIKGFQNFVESYNKTFIEKEKEIYKDLFKKGKYELDDKQKEAVIKDEENNLVIAGAGSGKTEVLITRIKYLLKRKGNRIRPEKVLALAFQKDAVQEIERRLNEAKKTNIKTFHSLGCKIVNKPLYGGSEEENHDNAVNELIKNVFVNLLENKKYYEKVLLFFENYASLSEKIKTEEDYDYDMKKYYDYLKTGKKYQTIANRKVKSEGEREILNFFFSHRLNGKDIDIKYEEPADWMKYTKEDGTDWTPKPDFFFPEYNLYWEHWALDKNGAVPKEWQRDYKENMKLKKRAFKQQKEYHLIESTYGESKNKEKFRQILEERFLKKLKEMYPDKEFVLEPIKYEDLIKKVWNSSEKGWYEGSKILQNIHKNINSFIKNAKVYCRTPDKIRESIAESGEDISKAFAEIAVEVYEKYESVLRDKNEIDFNDMINQSIEIIRSVKQKEDAFRYDQILVDEFQDISDQRFLLIKALLERNPDAHLFCVGDDWQSIMSFAGSDLEYFVHFKDRFGRDSEETFLNTNYRCGEKIINLGNKIISKNIEKNPDSQLPKSIICSKNNQGKGIIRMIKYTSNQRRNGELMINIQDQLEEFKNNGYSKEQILVLSRFDIKKDPYLDRQFKNFIRDNTIVKTIHKSKGSEARVVILLGVERGVYGFPSEIENSYLFRIARGGRDVVDKYDEERRLFYVTVTRAKEELIIYTSSNWESKFIKEILPNKDIDNEKI